MEELKACQSFKRFTHTYEDGKAWMPAAGITFMGEGELAGAPIDRLALYESLLQMEPAEAALKLRRPDPENKALTLEQLKRMDREPVWIQGGDTETSGWSIFKGNSQKQIANCPDDWNISYYLKDYGKTWIAYARKPEGSA